MLFNEETIEAYVSGHLTGTDKSLFEAGMAKDPLLMREVKMQEDVISSLKAHRKAELKQRLNNIDMSTASINLGAKVAASVAIATLVGAGLYMFINMTSEPAQTIATASPANTNAVQTQTQTAPQSATVVAPQAQNQTSAPAQAQHNSTRPATTAASEVVVEVPVVEAPTGTEVTTSGNGTPKDDFSNGSRPVSEVKGNTVEKITGYTKGYAYQYYSNKLFLYGFDKSSSAVNILEFNKNGKKQLFIYTNNQYYQIKDNQLDVTPLSAIKDQSTINQLNSFAH